MSMESGEIRIQLSAFARAHGPSCRRRTGIRSRTPFRSTCGSRCTRTAASRATGTGPGGNPGRPCCTSTSGTSGTASGSPCRTRPSSSTPLALGIRCASRRTGSSGSTTPRCALSVNSYLKCLHLWPPRGGLANHYVDRLLLGLMDGGESMDLRRIPGAKAARYAILSFAKLRAWFNGRT